jgi:class 3 adenylate cyclase
VPSKQAAKELSFDEKLDKIQRYLPKGITEKILSQRDRIEGERKQVTVMFCDMESFSPLVETLGPEEAYSIMDQVYEILIHKVHDYEGTVNEMTGDGIIALFGAPIALEDAPQRAIRSAYSIHKEMAGFSEKMKQEQSGIPPIKMRIGIHTGPVVVGTLGNDGCKGWQSRGPHICPRRLSDSPRGSSGLRHWVDLKSKAKRKLSKLIG